jgi:hypothetical protein
VDVEERRTGGRTERVEHRRITALAHVGGAHERAALAGGQA